MEQPMADLRRHFALGNFSAHGSASRLQRMADQGPKHLEASLFVGREGSPQAADLIANKLVAVHGAIASDLAVMAQIGQKLLSSPLPGPFLELKTQPVQFLVEQALRIDVAGNHPALIGREIEDGHLRGVKYSAGSSAAC